MKKIYLLNLILIIISSCKSSNDDYKEKYLSEENRIISQLCCELVKPTLQPPLPGATNLEITELLESQQKFLDTTQFEVHISDILTRPNSKSLDINDSLKEFESIYKKLLNDTNLYPRKLSIQSINLKCNYKLITTNTAIENRNNITQSKSLIGSVSFSRISFNLDLSKACFFMSLNRGKHSAISEFVLAIKQNNEWKILKNI